MAAVDLCFVMIMVIENVENLFSVSRLLGNGVSLCVVAGLVSEVLDAHGLAICIRVDVRTADDHDFMRLVLVVEGFFPFSGLLTNDAVFRLVT